MPQPATSPHLQIVTTTDPDPAQRAAWRWLWARLLAPENSNAPEGATPRASLRDPDDHPDHEEFYAQPHPTTS